MSHVCVETLNATKRYFSVYECSNVEYDLQVVYIYSCLSVDGNRKR